MIKHALTRNGIEDALSDLRELHHHPKAVERYAFLLRGCGDSESLPNGKRVHEHMLQNGYGENVFLGDLLVQMYGKCRDLAAAGAVFENLPRKGTLSWNIMIGVYGRNGHGRDALDLYHKMNTAGIQPDRLTFIAVVRACSTVRNLEEAKTIHANILRSKIRPELLLQNALVSMYGKCGSVELAAQMFENTQNRDVVSWNSMIAAYAQNGYSEKAMDLYERMHLEGMKPDKITFSSILGSCSNLEDGKRVHACIYGSDVSVQNALVSMYARCGHLDIARSVFQKIQNRDVVSWNAMIAAYAQQGYPHQAVQVYQDMVLDKQIEADNVTFTCVISACSSISDMVTGKSVHLHISNARFKQSATVDTALCNMYGKCGMLDVAREVFDQSSNKKSVSVWNAMISTYVQDMQGRKGLELYREMKGQGVQADRITFTNVFSACNSVEDLKDGIEAHQRMVSLGIKNDVIVETALLNMYSKCGSLETAKEVFDRMRQRNVISYNAMISAYTQHGEGRAALDLYEKMESEGFQPDDVTYVNALGACSSVVDKEEGIAIHSRIISRGFLSNIITQTALVSMYAKCNMMDTAKSVFDQIPVKNVVSWNAMLTAYAQQGYPMDAVVIYWKMKLEGIAPDSTTFASALTACSHGCMLALGKQIHALMIIDHCELSVVVGTALLNMYCKCAELGIARGIFDELKLKNTVSWNTMITAYAQHGHPAEALKLYDNMEASHVLPDRTTLAAALGACSSLEALDKGVAIHQYATSRGMDSDLVFGTAIMNLYGRLSSLELARQIFDGMVEKNAVFWATMIFAYAHRGHFEDVVDLFFKMDAEGVEANDSTYSCVFSSCSALGWLKEGKEVHARAIAKKQFIELEISVQNAIVNLYAKCGCLSIAKEVFDVIPRRDAFSWNAIISGYAQHGNAHDVVWLQEQMDQEGVQPDGISFISILLACSHAGLLEESRRCFLAMVADYGLCPSVEHFVCIADAFSRSGRLESAEELINSMPFEPYALAWTTLLGSCSMLGDAQRGSQIAENVLKLEPESGSSYVLLANIYRKG